MGPAYPTYPMGSRLCPLAAVALVVACAGCGGGDTGPGREAGGARPGSALSIPVEALADSAAGGRLHVDPPASAWIVRVRPSSPADLNVPPPEAALEVPPDTSSRPLQLDVDPGLRPPIPKRPARIRPLAGVREPASVELEVRVDDQGRVTEAIWAGGTRDAAFVDAAIACARTMEFFPAYRGGVPVAVWCRQRFEFGR